MIFLKKTNQTGVILVSIIIIFPFLIFLTITFLTLTTTSFSVARKDQLRTHAQLGADAGVDYALYEISEDGSWVGTTNPLVLHDSHNIKTTYEIVVDDIDADQKLVTSIGKTYNPSNDGTPKSTITIKATLRAIRTSGSYSIVTGVGGLYLSNSAKILGGDVLVNGEVSISNTSQIGMTNNPVNVKVAHQNCPDPPDETYPRLCADGERGEPINIDNTAKIYGSVRANNQVSGDGMLNPGLVATSGVEPQPLPPHDRNAQIASIATTQSALSASCNSVGGTRLWPANLKIEGNVTISHTCKVTILGDVWITGTLKMTQSAQIITDDSLGTNRPNIMVDGQNNYLRNGATLVSNTDSTGSQLITYWSNSSCSPNCSDVIGDDLYNSRNISTIELDNTASGPNSVFYARWSRVLIKNSGQLGALVGQTVELKNSGIITFGTEVNPGGGEAYWVISSYQRG